MNTAYFYLAYSAKSTDVFVFKTNKAVKFPIRRYDNEIQGMCDWVGLPILKMKDCPHSINVIKNKEDVVKYANFLLTGLNIISTKFAINIRKTCSNLYYQYHDLVGRFPVVFSKPITKDVSENKCSLTYLMTTNKSNINHVIESAEKVDAKIEFLDGCHELFHQCKNHLPIPYGVFYRMSSLYIFSPKQKDWEKKYGITQYRCVQWNEFKDELKNNNQRVFIKRINGL